MKQFLLIVAVFAISLSVNAQYSVKLKIQQVLYSENGSPSKLENVNMKGTLFQNKDKTKCIVTVDASTKVRAEGTLSQIIVLDGLPTHVYNAIDHHGQSILLSVAVNSKTNSTYIKFEYSNLVFNYLCKVDFDFKR